MSREQTQFIVLLNEVIGCIFEFLTTLDILRAFTQINRRDDDLVQSYIKRLDLNNGWQGDRQELQWISVHIIMKVYFQNAFFSFFLFMKNELILFEIDIATK